MPRRIETFIHPDGTIKIETFDFPGQECEKAKDALYAHLKKDGIQIEELEKQAKLDGIKVKVLANELDRLVKS